MEQTSRRFESRKGRQISVLASEATHAGESRFVVEGALDGTPLCKGQSARERAIEVFSPLRIWDTEDNNGLLIYLLLADRAVEIVADRGLHAKVGALARMSCPTNLSSCNGTTLTRGAESVPALPCALSAGIHRQHLVRPELRKLRTL